MALTKTFIFNVTRNEPEMVRALDTSSKSNPTEIKALSDIDDQEGLRGFIPIFFMYPPSSEGQILSPIKSIKEALSKALETYYPIAGRIFEGANKKLMINCNNEGVLFVEAYANVKLEQLGNGNPPPWPYLDKLICDIPTSQEVVGTPLVFVQVTMFLCGGFSLGIVWNHAIGDAYGSSQFLSAMGDILKVTSTPSVSVQQPVWQRELLCARSPPRITCIHNEYIQNFSSKQTSVYPEDTFVLTSVFFGQKEIQALRSQVVPTSSSQVTSFASFDLITACLWKCRTIALEPHPDTIVRILMVVNARTLKGMNLPPGYYGNAFAVPAAISKADILCSSPLEYALDLIRRTKTETNVEYIRSVTDLMVIEGRPTFFQEWNFVVSDIRKIGLHKMDLGWGKPSFGGVPWATPFASFYNEMKNDKGEIGVVVPICLPSLALDKFRSELLKMTRGSLISRI